MNKMRSPLKHREKGLTLIELMIDLGILLPVLGIALAILVVSNEMSEESRERLLALNAARSTLEAVKDTPLVNVPAIPTAPLVPAGLRNGAINITTNPVNLVGAQIATVTVTVSWSSRRNRAKTLQVTTMRSQF